MPILLVSLGVVLVAGGVLKWLLRRDPIWESLASHQRRQWAEGWTDAPRWRFDAEIEALRRKGQA